MVSVCVSCAVEIENATKNPKVGLVRFKQKAKSFAACCDVLHEPTDPELGFFRVL